MNIQQGKIDFDRPVEKTGEELRDEGIQKAVEHADEVHESWSDKAYQFLLDYDPQSEFMTEDLRQASTRYLPEPPSLRAWGAVVVRAVKNGVIQRVGYRAVSNNKAHRTPASVWIKI